MAFLFFCTPKNDVLDRFELDGKGTVRQLATALSPRFEKRSLQHLTVGSKKSHLA